jgi:acylphosphatase
MEVGTKAVVVRIEGRVQGVGFRAWTRGEAARLGLRGWVRNEPDGSVAAHIEGPGDGVDRMLERLRIGPPGASVTNIQADPAEALGREERFRIV